jgi:ParB family transcriptional regulator, chromosome partitioning protein
MAKSLRSKELGKGIRALLTHAETDSPADENAIRSGKAGGSVFKVPLELIEINPFQPRTEFDEGALKELSDSIVNHGLIQPITLRQLSQNSYQLISGERRLRASKLAGLTDIPAYIRVANDQEMLEMALVENIQRENLNAIEIALSLQRLVDECSLTHELLSDRVNKNRSTVTNYLRLLKLPPDIQSGIKNKQISMGHARALAGVGDPAFQLSIYKEIIAKGLSVREVESLIKKAQEASHPSKKKAGASALSDEYLQYKQRLSRALGLKVDLKKNPDGSGKLIISYNSEDDLNKLLDYSEDR